MLSAFAGFINRHFVNFPSLPVASVRQLVWGNGLVQLISLFSYPLLLLWYSPEAMGELGVISSVLSIGGVLACLRYDQAIVLSRNKEEVNALFWLGTVISFLLCLAAFGLLQLAVVRDNIPLFGLAEPYLPWLLLAIFIFSLFQLQQNWLTRQASFKAISFLRVGQKILVVAIQLLAVLAVWQTNGLIIGLLAGTISFGFLGIIFLRKAISFPVIREMKLVLKRYRDFPLYNAGVLLLELPLTRILYFLIPLFFDLRYAGWYTIAALLLSLPEIVIGQGVGQVLYRQLATEDRARHKVLILEALKSLLKSACITFILYLLLSAFAFYPLQETAWEGASFFLLILLPGAFVRFLSVPIAHSLFVWRKMPLAVLYTLASLAFKPLLFCLGYWMESIYLSLLFVSFFEVIIHSLFILMVYRLANRYEAKH